MHFAIRYMTEYSYEGPVSDNLNALRVRPATTSSQRCDEFHTRIEPEARVSRHLDYFGTEVLEFGVPTAHESLTIDVRARVVTSDPPEPPRGSWESVDSDAYIDAAGEFALPWQDQPMIAGLEEMQAELAGVSPLVMLEQLCERIPDRFEYRRGVTYVGSTVEDLLETRVGSARTSCTYPWCCSVALASPRATYPATCGQRRRTAARIRSRSTRTPGWRLCSPEPTGTVSRYG